MTLKKFVALCVAVYGTLLIVFGTGRTDSPAPSSTVPITVATVIAPLALPTPSAPPTAPSTTTTTTAAPTTTTTAAPTTAHDAMQADIAVWDALDALPADTKCVEWMELAISAGWPADPQVLHKLGTILWKESRCQPLVYGGPGTHNWDVGLTQINQIHREWVEQIFGEPYEIAMSDPWKNLHFAYRLWESRETGGKCGWKPWSLPC